MGKGRITPVLQTAPCERTCGITGAICTFVCPASLSTVMSFMHMRPIVHFTVLKQCVLRLHVCVGTDLSSYLKVVEMHT